MRIHPSSIISPRAQIGNDVAIGPFCVVEPNVVIGDGTRIEARVSIKQGTTLGEQNLICEGAVIGGLPQHRAIQEVDSQVVIGNGNVIRENCTIHKAMKEGNATVIGNGNMLMVGVHVAHDCAIGDNSLFANNIMLAGHVTIGNKANLSGGLGVHQFCRIGDLAMVGGLSLITQDVPPFVLVDGHSSAIVGLNLIGLRRAGFNIEQIKQLKEAYRTIFCRNHRWEDVIRILNESFPSGPVSDMAKFLAGSTRGIIPERRNRAKIMLKLHEERSFEAEHIDDDETPVCQVKAG